MPAPVKFTVAELPVPLEGLAPLEGVTVHVMMPGIPPVAVNVTDCPTLEVWFATDELINIEVGGEQGFKPTAIGAELVCCTGAQVPSPIFTILNIAV